MNVIQYKCRSCGGDLKFDPESGKYTCEYCRSVFLQEELDRQTETKQAGSGAPASADTEEDSRVYSCPSCGAQIVTDATTAATFCYYCHNPVVLSGRLDGGLKPDYIVPFKIGRERALEIFETWLKKHKYVPRSFYSKEQIEKFSGVYFPYLLYTCNIAGTIQAEARSSKVYMRGSVEYTESGRYMVERDGKMEVKHVMRNALKKANRILSECVLPFSFEEMKPFNMSYLSGFFAEKRDMDTGEFTGEVRQEVMNYAVSRLQESLVQYDNIRVTQDNTRLENEEWKYALMPVWTLTYNGNGKVYYFSINGQTGKTVGELPVDRRKLFFTFVLVFVPFCLALLALFYFVI